jgi:D-serine deaminase-like pyridoxal phosphate-dependent protein
MTPSKIAILLTVGTVANYFIIRRNGLAHRLISSFVKRTFHLGKSGQTTISNVLDIDAPMHLCLPKYLIGQSVSNVPTPALIIDLDKMEQNLEKMNKSLALFKGVKIRPHYKANKCPELVLKQIEFHKDLMSGVCCQKLSEAESLLLVNSSSAMVKNIFISNEMVEDVKLERLVKIVYEKPDVTLSLAVDNLFVVRKLVQICDKYSKNYAKTKKIKLLIEYNVGQNRCGVNSVQELVDLANFIVKEEQCSKYLHFVGIHCYQGWNQHVRSFSERKKAVEYVNNKTKEALKALEQQSLTIADFIVTGGGTGSYIFEASSGVFTEVQPGSYVFMDADYNRNLAESGKTVEEEHEFVQSLFVLSTVISKDKNNSRAVIDAGMKAVSLDSGVPLLADEILRTKIEYKSGGDEHGILQPLHASEGCYIENLSVGDKLKLIPGHCDPTVNLHDWFICVRGDKVVDVWSILGRSCGI